MQLLTDSEINRIKRDIAIAFNKLLFQAKVKQLLRIPAYVRKESEVAKLVKFLKGLSHFQQGHDLVQSKDYIELTNCMYFNEYEEGQVIYDIGMEPNQYFMILSGSVSIKVKNPHIKNWDWARKMFNSLNEWKSKVFDKKVEKAMQIHMFKSKLVADTK